MNWERISNVIGLSLLGICFAIAVTRVVSRTAEEHESGLTIVRFAHWQLEGGVRVALDDLARAYEKDHPGVRMEQMAIPESVYRNWQRTQLIGGTAPDLIELGQGGQGVTEELLARYFTPISSLVEEPNPYNKGTELEGVPWRETFVDGLSNVPAYSESLVDYYGISASMFTVRVYYNADLFRRVTGHEEIPKTYDEFIEVCKKAAAYRTSTGEKILPIAGSRYNAPLMVDQLFASMTQRLALELNQVHSMRMETTEVALGYLKNKWNWETPAVRAGLTLMNSLGQFMQPGFLQLGRDDALFYFVQGRALLLASGSWDSSSIAAQAPFRIGVFSMPLPGRDQPEFGKYVLGTPSEAGTGTGLVFGLTTQSKKQEQAIDFLRFISSKAGNARFAQVSGWLPAVVGVPPNEKIAPFMPMTDGYIKGFTPAITTTTVSFGETGGLVGRNLHRLVGQGGSPEKFVEGVAPDYAQALTSDLRLQIKNSLRTCEEKDTALAANWILGGKDKVAQKKFDQLIESQNNLEQDTYRLRRELDSAR